MNEQEFPSQCDVAAQLEDIWSELNTSERAALTEGLDVRLQVLEDGSWDILTGDPCYDTDHRGYWGAGVLGQDTDCNELAGELLDEVMEHESHRKG